METLYIPLKFQRSNRWSDAENIRINWGAECAQSLESFLMNDLKGYTIASQADHLRKVISLYLSTTEQDVVDKYSMVIIVAAEREWKKLREQGQILFPVREHVVAALAAFRGSRCKATWMEEILVENEDNPIAANLLY